MSNLLHLLGIAQKAGRLALGEEPVGAAARARSGFLILLAGDAADNTVRRAAHFAQTGKLPVLSVSQTKAELGQAVGRSSLAMLAITDAGLAAAAAKQVAADQPEQANVQAAFSALTETAARIHQRQVEKRNHEKNRRRKKM